MLTLTSQIDALRRHTEFSSRIEYSLAYSSGASEKEKACGSFSGWQFSLASNLSVVIM